MGSFNGIRIAYSGIRANQFLVDMASGNVANAGTAGYVRRGATLKTLTGTPGGGADVAAFGRIRDDFTDRRLLSAVGRDGAAMTRADVLLRLEEATLGDGFDTLAGSVSDVMAAFEDLTSNPTSPALRANVLSTAERFAGQVRQTAELLNGVAAENRTQLPASVGELNDVTRQIALLNSRVAAAGGGDVAPDIADERDRLIARAAELAGVSTIDDPDGTTRVMLGGIPLVQGNTSVDLGYDVATATFSVAPDGFVVTPGGELGARRDLEINTFPARLADLNTAALAVAAQFNALHSAGEGDDGIGGRNLFAGADAATFTVDPAVAGNPDAIAARAAGAGRFDSSVATAIAALADNPSGPSTTINEFFAAVASDANAAVRNMQVTSAARGSAQDLRDEVSAVSIDEELTNLTAAQTAFEASARVFTAVDSLLDTLINRTGLVGR